MILSVFKPARPLSTKKKAEAQTNLITAGQCNLTIHIQALRNTPHRLSAAQEKAIQQRQQVMANSFRDMGGGFGGGYGGGFGGGIGQPMGGMSYGGQQMGSMG